MRRGTSGGLLLLSAALLAGCGPDWQPSWNMSSRPVVTGDSLTIQRVTGNDPEFQVLRTEDPAALRLSAGALTSTRPTSPEAAITSVPEFRTGPRPEVDAHTGPRQPATPPSPVRAGSSTPPPVASVPPRATVPVRPAVAPVLPPREDRVEGRVVQVPGQPAGAVTGGTGGTGGTGRVQSFSQPGNPAGGVAIQDGGQTTIIQPGGRVVTVPSVR